MYSSVGMDRLGEKLSQLSESGGCRAVFGLRRVTVEISLGPDCLAITSANRNRHLPISIPLEDIVFVSQPRDQTLVIAAMGFPVQKTVGCFAGCHRRRKPGTFEERKLSKTTLEFREESTASVLQGLINEVCFCDPKPVSSALVVINPVAGKGKAKSIWRSKVEPLLKESRMFEYETVTTDRSGHALDIGSGVLLEKLKAMPEGEHLFLIIIGGDGVVYELLNGIHQGEPEGFESLVKKIVLCPLPAGSGNGLCFSALCLAKEAFTLNTALRLLLRQRFGAKDLGLVHFQSADPIAEGETSTRVFALTISWGLVADVDIQSEFLRKYFGDSRFTIYGLVKVLQKQEYEGSLTWEGGDQTEIEPDYLTVFATLVPVAGRTIILSPSKPLDGGTVHIHRLRGRDISRFGLIKAMDELEHRREHAECIPGFEPLVARNFELVPGFGPPVPGSAGIVVDGEPLTFSAIRVQVLPNACSIFST
jgi:diacylglycerol kinase family enzyme